MNKGQHGFGAIGVIFVIIVVGVLGFVGWRIYESQIKPAAQQNANTPDTNQQTPAGFREYSSSVLGVRFAYPEAWGDVSTEQIEGSVGSETKLRFSKNAQVTAALQTSDFKPKFGGSGYSFGGPGFASYDQRMQQVIDADAQRQAGNPSYSTTILEKTSNYLVYADMECVDNGYSIISINKLSTSKFAGIAFGYFKDLRGVADACHAPLAEFLESGVKDQMIEVSKTVESL